MMTVSSQEIFDMFSLFDHHDLLATEVKSNYLSSNIC